VIDVSVCIIIVLMPAMIITREFDCESVLLMIYFVISPKPRWTRLAEYHHRRNMAAGAFSIPILLITALVAFLRDPVYFAQESFAPDKLLLLTAHPDDECMFFAPTLLSLTSSDAEVYSLCLSSGNADGLGDVRKNELEGSLDVLGVKEGRRWIVDHP
jgi:hypothetical protein